ncbi:hypothetical protein [Nonomuraea turcica]|uniref:hypothetical protein n=1 Tax=Nonomuraea sp. G32 TaxID=3067274 RepID=UPI00273CD41D|nr:hypothetical protein [Nonomuraea sp. G32]MDP4508290.1 hypothetical protein [Nonomuraea sp. G32]
MPSAPHGGIGRRIAHHRSVARLTQQERCAGQYVQTRRLPDLLAELFRALQTAPPEQRPGIAALTASACRSADAVAYKFGAYDLSARLIDLMRWAAPQADDGILTTAIVYVRTETFFAAHEHGLRALEPRHRRRPPAR